MEPNVRTGMAVISIETAPVITRDFDEVVQLHWRRIFRFVLASVRDREAAEDLTQDCFCRAYKGWKRFRGDSSVTTWLVHIAVNLVRDYARNRKLQFWRRAPSLEPETVEQWLQDDSISPEANVVLRDNVRAIWTAAAGISSKQKTAFLLRFVEGMELSEIAGVMGITENAVKVHLFRAVHAIRKKLRVEE